MHGALDIGKYIAPVPPSEYQRPKTRAEGFVTTTVVSKTQLPSTQLYLSAL
jgi:hypothetical protein